MNVRNLHNNPEILVFEECGKSLDGLRCRFLKLVEAIKREYQARIRLREFRKLSARQLNDIGLSDPHAQTRVLGRPIDLGSIDRDQSRYALFGDESRRL